MVEDAPGPCVFIGKPCDCVAVGRTRRIRPALDAKLVGLAVVGLLSSVAGLYYYLRVIVVMYMRPSAAGQTVPPRTAALGIGLGLAAAVTVVFGVGPRMLSDVARIASEPTR